MSADSFWIICQRRLRDSSILLEYFYFYIYVDVTQRWLIIRIFLSVSINLMFTGAYPNGLQTMNKFSNKPIFKVIAFPIFRISLSLCFYYCSSIATWTLMLPCFVSQYCLCRQSLQSFISVSLAPVNCLWDWRQRRCEGACVLCTSAAPLWHKARYRQPCSCRRPDADAFEARWEEQPRVFPGGAREEMMNPHQPVRKSRLCGWKRGPTTHPSHLR